MPIEKENSKVEKHKGSGERTESRLNTRDYTGGREKLRGLQNDYFEHLTQRYDGGKKFGLELFRVLWLKIKQKNISNKLITK